MSLRVPPSSQWEICADANYRGCMVVNSDWADLARVNYARRISSARPWQQGGGGVPAPGAMRLVLFDELNYRGRAFNVDNARPTLTGFNNRAESVQVFGGTWELCDSAGFRGRCVVVSANVQDLGALGLRNRVGSARPCGDAALSRGQFSPLNSLISL